MGPKKRKTCGRKQELTESESEEFLKIRNLVPMLGALKQHIEENHLVVDKQTQEEEDHPVLDKQTQKKEVDRSVLDKQTRENDIKFAYENITNWVNNVTDPHDINNVREFLNVVSDDLDILLILKPYEANPEHRHANMDFALLRLWESNLTDFSGFDGLCTIDDAIKAKIQTMANTLKLHSGTAQEEAADSEMMEVIYISDDSDTREDKGTKISAEDANTSANDKPLSEEEEDWGEMEEVSDDSVEELN